MRALRIIWKRYLASALEHSATRVNAAISALQGRAGHTRRQNIAAAFSVDWDGLRAAQNAVERLWVQALGQAGALHMDKACALIRPMEDAAAVFETQAKAVIKALRVREGVTCAYMEEAALTEVMELGAQAEAAGGSGTWGTWLTRWVRLLGEAAVLLVILLGVRAAYIGLTAGFGGGQQSKPKFN